MKPLVVILFWMISVTAVAQEETIYIETPKGANGPGLNKGIVTSGAEKRFGLYNFDEEVWVVPADFEVMIWIPVPFNPVSVADAPYILAKKEDRYFLFDRDGRLIIPGYYSDLSTTGYNSTTWIAKSPEKGYGLINMKGDTLLSLDHDRIAKMRNGRITVERAGKRAVVSESGAILEPYTFFGSTFYMGNGADYSVVKFGELEGLYDENFEQILPPVYKSINRLHTYMKLTFPDGKTEVRNADATLRIPAKYYSIIGIGGVYGSGERALMVSFDPKGKYAITDDEGKQSTDFVFNVYKDYDRKNILYGNLVIEGKSRSELRVRNRRGDYLSDSLFNYLQPTRHLADEGLPVLVVRTQSQRGLSLFDPVKRAIITDIEYDYIRSYSPGGDLNLPLFIGDLNKKKILIGTNGARISPLEFIDISYVTNKRLYEDTFEVDQPETAWLWATTEDKKVYLLRENLKLDYMGKID